MNRLSAITETLGSRSDGSHATHISTITLGAAVVCTVWYTAVSLVCAVGYTQLKRHYSQPPPKSTVSDSDAPHVTIIRPVKGLEPSLYQCLESTFLQEYPKDRLTVFLCVADRQDPAFPVLQQLIKDNPTFDAHVLVEEEDPELQGSHADTRLGPNPKVRNMSRAYREAKGDVVWIIDCNVWVNRGACGRMVDTLIGNRGIKNKFVHLLPLVVDVAGTPVPESAQSLLEGRDPDNNFRVVSTSTAGHQLRPSNSASLHVLSEGGGRIEELFMSSAHAKFYTAINTVLIAPCIVGKSTMFRKSHLNSLTNGQGIDFFSENICEDHLIGDLLWKGNIPEEERGEKWGKHAQVFGDLAIQPMAGMSVAEYIARRSRWLRVRKFTVTLATLVEPGTECFLCSLYGAFAFTTLPFFHDKLGVPQTWTAFALFWICSVCTWCYIDWTLYCKLHSCASVEVDENTPAFARPPREGRRRPFLVWLAAWLARETLALPIWTWAVYGGVTVVWRGKKLWVGMDMKVHEIKSDSTSAAGTIDASKARTD
ncbi:glycosyltransferase family 21 protein, partial [Aureobasidium melanogenum]